MDRSSIPDDRKRAASVVRARIAAFALPPLAFAASTVAPALAFVATTPAPALASAQEGPASVPVEGWVVDAESGAPLLGARVWVQGSAPAYTDADGFFALGMMPAGEHTLQARHLIHTPRELPIRFGDGHPRPRIALEPDPGRVEQLDEVRALLARDRRDGAQFFRLVEREELLAMSGEELYDRARTLIPYGGPCEISPNTGRCRGIDGPLLVVDDDVGGMRMRNLEGLDPASLYVVELYPDRRLVHAYTVDFIARAMERPALLFRARRTPL